MRKRLSILFEKKMETCLISAGSMAAVFDQKIWDGFEMLKEEGWKVTLIEALDTAEYEEPIYAMAEAGMELIFLKGEIGSGCAWAAKHAH